MSDILANLRKELDSTFVFDKVPENVTKLSNALYVSIGKNFGCLTEISFEINSFDLFFFNKDKKKFI